MEKKEALTVKIYFIEPIDLISVVIDTLVKLNFEAYSIIETDKEKLLHIIKNNERNVIYICVNNDISVKTWLEYIDKVQKIKDIHIQIGAFIHNHMDTNLRHQFFERGMATIQFSSLQKNTVKTLKKILKYFEAKGKRKYIRAKSISICQSFFTIKNLDHPIKADIVDISVFAFSCMFSPESKIFFEPQTYINEVILILRGRRIRISAKFIGFKKENPELGVFIIYVSQIIDNQLQYYNKLPPEIKNKIYDYIKTFLKEDIKRQLSEIKKIS